MTMSASSATRATRHAADLDSPWVRAGGEAPIAVNDVFGTLDLTDYGRSPGLRPRPLRPGVQELLGGEAQAPGG